MEGEELNKTQSIIEDSTPVMHLVMSVPIGIRIECKQVDTEEEANQTIERSMAVTQFPKWVQMYKVRRIRDLNCLETVREMFLSGMPTMEIARQVHALGELKDSSLESVRSYLEHYKATLPAWLLASRQQPKQYLELKKKADSTVDSLRELNQLYLWMKERIEIGINSERRFGLLTANLEKNFVVAAALLKQLDDVKQTGLTDEQAKQALPKSIVDQVQWDKVYARESVQKVLSDPQRRSRVLQVAERLIDLYSTKLTPEDVDKLEKQKAMQAAQEQVSPSTP